MERYKKRILVWLGLGASLLIASSVKQSDEENIPSFSLLAAGCICLAMIPLELCCAPSRTSHQVQPAQLTGYSNRGSPYHPGALAHAEVAVEVSPSPVTTVMAQESNIAPPFSVQAQNREPVQGASSSTLNNRPREGVETIVSSTTNETVQTSVAQKGDRWWAEARVISPPPPALTQVVSPLRHFYCPGNDDVDMRRFDGICQKDTHKIASSRATLDMEESLIANGY
ncbi:MAG: hypothetical protein K0R66_179 [Gammaproteobacteria bacterium]|jgi:hypothetical protein|nr:hypothetical protein [Gammaproteobacteria bacterium]